MVCMNMDFVAVDGLPYGQLVRVADELEADAVEKGASAPGGGPALVVPCQQRGKGVGVKPARGAA